MTPEVRFGMFRLGRGGLEVCRWLELVGPGRGLELRRAGLDVGVHISVVGASGISGSTTAPSAGSLTWYVELESCFTTS